MEMNEYHINHRYRDVIIIPYVGIDKSLTFMLDKSEKYILTADGARAKVVSWEEKHILDLEDKVQELYGIDILRYLKKWHKATNGNMDSMHFLIIKLKKDE